MSLTIEKVFLFDMQWTDDADYEYIFEDRLHDTMIPFFAFGDEATFSKEVDFDNGYKFCYCKNICTIYNRGKQI